MNHPIINTGNDGLWFSLISIFIFLLVNFVFILKGLRQKRPLESLLLISSAGILFFIIGIYLFPLSGSGLSNVLSQGTPSQPGEKSVLGGLLGLFARLVTIRLLKERMRLIDNIAVVFLIGLGLQNLGCFLSGCCYGIPSGLPWAVCYSGNASAMQDQLQYGLLQPGNAVSLPVHPVQLYLLIACFIAAFIAWKWQKKWKAPLSSFFFSIILYGLARFALEFLRDPATDHGAGLVILGIKEIQWFLLFITVFFSLLIRLRERKRAVRAEPEDSPNPGLIRIGCILLVLWFVNWWSRGFVDFANRILTDAFLFFTLAVVAWKSFRKFTLPRYRLATAFCLFAACILMSQSYIPQNEDEKVTYTEIGGGAEFGHFYNMVAKNMGQSTDCRGNPYYAAGNWKTMKYHSALAGFSYAKTENRSQFKRSKYGINLYLGADTEKGVDTVLYKNIPIVAAEPFVSFDGRWVGFVAGLHLGAFHYVNILNEGSASNVGQLIYDVKTNYIFPSVSFRLGPYDILYMKGSLADHFPSASPLMFSEFSVGSGLGKTDGRNISIGISTVGRFISATYPLNDQYYASAFFGYTPGNSTYPPDSRSLFSIGLHHRFNYKTIRKMQTSVPAKP